MDQENNNFNMDDNTLRCTSQRAPEQQQYDNFFNHIVHGHLEQVKHYTNNNPKLINGIRQGGVRSALMLAAKHNHASIIQYLLSLDESLYNGKQELLNTSGTLGMRALEYAALYGSEECANLLIDAGTDPCIAVGDGNRAIHFAAASGLVGLCKRLIGEFGVDVNIQNNFGESPLILAAEKNQLPVVQYLVEKCGANLELVGKRDMKALDYAHEHRSLDCYIYLKTKLGLIVATDSTDRAMTDLMIAARNGDLPTVNKLLRDVKVLESVNVQQEETGYTAIHYAVKEGQTHIVDRLLDQDILPIINLNAESIEGTVLQMATCLKEDMPYMSILRLLLNKGHLDPHTKLPDHNFQIIHFACATGKLDVVKMLIEDHKENPNIRGGKHDDTPLMVAAEQGQIAVIKYLTTLLSTSEVNTENLEGKRAIDFARESGYTLCAELLAKCTSA